MIRIYSKLGSILACIFFLILSFCRVSAQLPSGFTSNVVQSGYTSPMGVIFNSNGNSMFTWDKSGHLYVSKWNGTAYVKQVTTVLDISEEVGDWREHGFLSVCLDPDFDLNGLIYLYYVVDRHHLLYFGTSQYNSATNEYYKATIGRVTRYKLNLGTTITTDYSSRKILVGESKKTGIPVLYESHMGGTLIFGRDKTLLLSTGEGANQDMGSSAATYYQQALIDSIIRPEENVGSFRSQMINSHDGKVLRFDPNTGDGIASNPFYDGANPRSPKSRMWAMGFRNAFRMSIQPNTGSTNPSDANPGTLLVGDVGANSWEEINIINTGGLNFGWPLYEGELAFSAFSSATTINQDEGQPFKNLCLQPSSFTLDPIITNRRYTHYRPSVAWKHGATAEARVPWFNGTTPTDPLVGATGSPTTGQVFKGNCAIGGLYYTGSTFGSNYQNTYFFADFGVNWIKNASLTTGASWFSKISDFADENFTNGVVDMEQNPLDNSIFYVDINTGEIKRISLGGNLPPVTAISSNIINGASPLNVNFSSAGTVDPQGSALTYLWDFGDGTSSTVANPSHTFTKAGIGSFTVTLTVTNALSLFSSKSLLISINNSAPVAKINNPVNNSTYSILSETDVQLTSTVTDNETTTGMQYAWQVILRHNNHEHREPVITETNPTVQISPIGCDGETYYYVILLTVTDNGGLVGKDSVKIYPDCSTGGLAVNNLTAVPQNNSVQLSWTNPSASFDEVMVAAQPLTSFLSNPSGTNYIADANFTGTGTSFEQGKIVYKGNGQLITVTNLTQNIKYYFRVFTRIGNVWTGGVETSAIIPTGLTGAASLSTAAVNLSTEGTTDWAHWPGYDHKSTGSSKISDFSIIGASAAVTYNNDLRTCSWTDGSPTISSTNQNGVYIAGIGNGFQITAPADQTSRTLKVYVGGWKSGGTLTAQLSDGSSADYVNTSISGTGQYDGVYTLTYSAGSAGKLLTVKWVQSSGTGNVGLQAATLVTAAPPLVNVTGVTISPGSVALSINGIQQLTAAIAPANATNKTIGWSSNNTGVATVSATGLVTAISVGSATITVTTQDGNKTATSAITVNPPGSLTGTGVSTTTAVNLSIEGTTDWAHWPGYDHKSAGGSKISDFSIIGASAAVTYNNDLRTCSWTDGSPIVSGSNQNGVYIAGIGNGFQITAPADQNSRTLKVYVGGWKSGGTLTAQLSDGSSADYVNTSISGTGQYDGVYTITYSAGSAGKLLTVKWVQSSGTGNVSLQAATLVATAALINVTGVTVIPGSATLSINGTQQLMATIAPANASNQNVSWSSSNAGVATVGSGGLVTAISAGSATITVTTQDGNKTATSAITVNPPGSLTGTGVSTSTAVNLSTEGTTDWAHWSGYDHKSTGGSKISDFSIIGTGAAVAYNNDLRSFNWTDGSPTVSGSNQNGVYIAGIGNGFQITAPADQTSRTLKVYVGGWKSGGTLTAQLSDGSSADYVNTSISGTGQYDGVYTITYSAGSAGKLLTVKWVQSSGTGNVSLQAATLVATAALINVTGVTVIPGSATLSINGTQQLMATIAPANASNQNVSWSSSNAGVATVGSGGLVTAISAGSATITVTTQDGNKTATSAITVNPPGSLTGTGVSTTTAVNLSIEGTTDWAHWPGYDHKSAGGSKISDFSIIGASAAVTYNNDLRTCSWTDGSPTVSGSNQNGVYIAGIGNGFQITAPADQNSRTLKVYVGGWKSGGTLTAQLSDGSSADYVNTSISGTGQYDAVYTLTYSAGSAGKLLTVKWVQSSGTGNVGLQAATLVATIPVVNVTGVTVSPASAALSINATQQLTATIAPANATNKTIGWNSSNAGVATVSATGLVTAISAGSATITVTTQDGNKTATSDITVNPPASLIGAAVSTTAAINLSTEGTTDWAHWPGYDHKSTGGSKISDFSIIGASAAVTYNNDLRTCSWTDGSPTISSTNQNGVYIAGIGNGFQITAPADQTSRTLKVYVGGWKSGGTLTAQLSDGSSADYVNTSISGTGQYDGVYTITYSAGSAGKLLTVKWVQSSGTGNVSLQAATLVATAALINVTGVTVIPGSATLSINGTQQLMATIAPANASNQNVSWSSSNAGVATVGSGGLVTAISAGSATITVTTQDGNKTATSAITVNPPGSLTGTGVSTSTAVNLSTEGTTDWAHWSGYDHKSTGGSKISDFSIIGTGAAVAYNNDLRSFNWTDGSPTVSGSNQNGVYIAGIGNGFQITAPADQTSRTLKVYVGGWKSGGTLTAQLSDGSSADYVNTSISGTGQYDGVYTITYSAGSAGKLLTVKWVQSSGTGNVSLQAATLVESFGAFTSLTNTIITKNEIKGFAETDENNSLSNRPLTIFPNPFNDNLVLNYSGKENGKGTIALYNSEMRLIATYRFEKTSWNLNKKITAYGLTRGIYFIQVNLGTAKVIKKLVKM